MGARSIEEAVHEDDTYEAGEHESLAVTTDAVEVRRSAAVAWFWRSVAPPSVRSVRACW